jgi:adenosylmethionine-8-amino-7-oxononanoate aminotransferase
MAVLAPPLTTTAGELDELLDLLDEAVTEVVGRPLRKDAGEARVRA